MKTDNKSMSTIKAISIRQPWLDLILVGSKSIELRPSMPKDGMPDYLVLHAPLTIEYADACFFGYKNPWELKTGKLLAIARVNGVTPIDEKNQLDFVEDHRQYYPLEGQYYGFQLEEVKLLRKPINYSGRLILFSLDEETENLIRNEFLI
jgi:ASCH domain